MKLLKGSVLTLSNGTQITLESDTKISFPNSNVEASQIGLLQVTNNYEATPVQASNDWPANKEQFKFNRDGNGNLLPLEDQVGENGDVDAFIAKLSATDAETFGVAERRDELVAAKAAAKTKSK